MCEIATIVGLALTAGSIGANSYAQSQVTSARNDAMNAERIRQKGLDAKADVLQNQSDDRYKDFGKQQGQTASDLTKYFQSNQVPQAQDPNYLPPVNSSDNTVVQNEQAKQSGKAQAFSDQQAGALGTLRSFGDLMGGIGRLQARDATSIGQIGNFKQGSANVLGQEMDAANSAGNGMKMFGDILGGLGQLGTSYGINYGTSLFGGGANKAASTLGKSIAAPSMAASLYGPTAPLTGGALHAYNMY